MTRTGSCPLARWTCPDRRGPPREPLGGARGAREAVRRRDRDRVRGLGAQRPRRAVIGDFNHWDGRGTRCGPWRRRDLGAVLPDVGDGTRYKFDVCGPDGQWAPQRPTRWPTWPSGPPATASVIYTSRYEWSDAEWAAARSRRAADPRAGQRVRGAPGLVAARPVLRPARRRADRLRLGHGFTHVEFLPVAEHPFGGSGLPGHLLLRAHGPVRQPGTNSATWWTGCTRPGSA